MANKARCLAEYAALLGENGLITGKNGFEAGFEMPVNYISYDSADIKAGTLFVCKGSHFLPAYLEDALSKGAVAYVSESLYDVEGADPPYIIVNDVRKAMALIAGLYYDMVWESLNLVGLTGTKGKTTTAYFIKYILDDFINGKNKPESAIISSIDTYDGVINIE